MQTAFGSMLFVLAAFIATSPATSAAAQAPAPITYESAPPDFGPSNALHISAAIAAPLGTAGIVTGTLLSIGCAFGGGNCSGWAALALTGVGLVVASVALGIAATVVHFATRRQAARARPYGARDLPLLAIWVDPDSGAAGLQYRF